MNRGAARRKGKRKEAERKAVRAAEALAISQQRMWKRLSNIDRSPKVGYLGAYELSTGYYYCPYVPTDVNDTGAITTNAFDE